MAASYCNVVRSQLGVGLTTRGGLWPLSHRLLSTASSDGEPAKFQPPPKPVILDKRKAGEPQRKYLSPEFIPPRSRKDPFKYYAERKDMIERRKAINIPEFYPGSIMAVNMADPYANGKTNRFVGICIKRSGSGLGATFVLRNILEGQGVEIRYDLYSPRMQSIEVLKLEKRLDEDLMYLRDALPEYSTVDVNMKPVFTSSNEVPVNQNNYKNYICSNLDPWTETEKTRLRLHVPGLGGSPRIDFDIMDMDNTPDTSIKVRMKPKPWSKRWERPKYDVKGIRFDLYLSDEHMEEAKKTGKPWEEFDMLKIYDTTELEEKIWKEVNEGLNK